MLPLLWEAGPDLTEEIKKASRNDQNHDPKNRSGWPAALPTAWEHPELPDPNERHAFKKIVLFTVSELRGTSTIVW